MATFKHSKPVMVDHTPSTAVTAGDVVVFGTYPMIAHLDIAANAIGALAMLGGVYEFTAAADLAPGEKVYWDAAAGKVTNVAAAGANDHIGYVLPDSDPAADGDKVLVLHNPDTSSI